MFQRPRSFAAVLAAGFAASLVAGPVLASPCSEEIARLEAKVKEEATGAISASTSGKAAAGAREGQGETGQGGNASTPAAPPEKSAEAGKGSDAAMQAKVALDEARTADGKGDAQACNAALERAKSQLATAP
ncbi:MULTISPECIES: hypothetical protein [unclassified Methylobacterium]|jgi:hypothetical protein|uniref:hypothetical protein n=1 Tax=unclassified Methylobacterium TaxID=2615210 RepID=UPI00037C71E5|nr:MULTISPECIES: hypothetical protein [unclassified Methylobacterium]KQP46960.1 hypothetical protein ASF34_04840 [Methylobacterium sp. Leaf106]TXN25724.1 hypothetical protein FV220_17645 [Methylobacterium sp. WL19]